MLVEGYWSASTRIINWVSIKTCGVVLSLFLISFFVLVNSFYFNPRVLSHFQFSPILSFIPLKGE